MNKLLILFLLCSALISCENRYRYACQNPDNWEEDYCKKPKCEVSRECPEHIFKGESGVATFSNPSRNNCSECKGASK